MGNYTSAFSFEAPELLHWAFVRFKLKSDSELSRLIGIPQPNLSKMRHGHLPVSPVLVLELLAISNLSPRDFEKSVVELNRKDIAADNA